MPRFVALARAAAYSALLIAGDALAQAPSAADPSALPLPTPEARAYVAGKLYAALQTHFAHWADVPASFDVDSAYRAYLGDAFAARDRRAYALATTRFVAAMRNGHTWVYDTLLLGRIGQPLEFEARPVENRWTVVRSRRASLRPGDVIVAVDGEPVENVARRHLPYLFASDERWARRRVFSRNASYLFPQRFTVTLQGGRSSIIDRADTLPPPAPTRTEGRLLDGGRVAYVRIPSFGARAFEDSALALVERFRTVPALILDVRENGGGSTPSRLTRALMDRPYRWYGESTPLTPGLPSLRDRVPRAQLRWESPLQEPDTSAYRGRVVLLVDGGCFSACEDFVVYFKGNGRAQLVGDTTGGSSGQPVFPALGHGLIAGVSSKREYLPDGRPLEGNGIPPDVVVPQSVRDVREGRDPVLARALALVAGRPR